MTEQNDKLAEAAQGLATEIAPSRDLWPGVEQAITAPRQPRQRRQTPWYAQAAAVLLLVGASSFVTYQVMQVDQAGQPQQTVVQQPVPTNMTFERAAFGGDHTLQSVYGRAAGDVGAKLDRGLENLSPDARADVERNLAVIRQAISDISSSLEEDPNNEFLQELLIEAYSSELALMNRVGSMARRVAARTDI